MGGGREGAHPLLDADVRSERFAEVEAQPLGPELLHGEPSALELELDRPHRDLTSLGPERGNQEERSREGEVKPRECCGRGRGAAPLLRHRHDR